MPDPVVPSLWEMLSGRTTRPTRQPATPAQAERVGPPPPPPRPEGLFEHAFDLTAGALGLPYVPETRANLYGQLLGTGMAAALPLRSRLRSPTAVTPSASKSLVDDLEAMSTDEAMGVEFPDDGPSVFPDGSHAVVCTNCAEQIINKLGRGHVYGWEEGTNPTSVVAGPTRGARVDRGQGHDFAIIDDRYLVDPWAKNVEAQTERAAWDLHDPADRAEVLRLYGDPTTWKRRGPRGGWTKHTPTPLADAVVATPPPRKK